MNLLLLSRERLLDSHSVKSLQCYAYILPSIWFLVFFTQGLLEEVPSSISSLNLGRFAIMLCETVAVHYFLREDRIGANLEAETPDRSASLFREPLLSQGPVAPVEQDSEEARSGLINIAL